MVNLGCALDQAMGMTRPAQWLARQDMEPKPTPAGIIATARG